MSKNSDRAYLLSRLDDLEEECCSRGFSMEVCPLCEGATWCQDPSCKKCKGKIEATDCHACNGRGIVLNEVQG